MRPRLLLVEDEPEIGKLLHRFLSRTGFEVVWVRDGEAATRRFAAEPFHLVLTDGLLPKKTGLDIAREIRASPRGARTGVVMMTAAFRTGRARRDAYDVGVDAFFEKPFVVTELRAKLLELLERQREAGSDVAIEPSAPVPADARAKPASSPASAVSSPLPEARRPAPPEPPTEPRSLLAPGDAARALLDVARARATGILRFTDGSAALEIAFARGIPVGAWDNLRENALGERLLREGVLGPADLRRLLERLSETKERVGEALIALGLCDEAKTLSALEAQARERLRRAATWSCGSVQLVEDSAAVERASLQAMDLLEVLLEAALDGEGVDARREFAARRDETVEKTVDFEEGLLAFARLRPESPLPGAILAGTKTVGAVLGGLPLAAVGELCALRFAGLVRLGSDPPADERVIPRALRREEAADVVVDKELVARLQRALLRARGGTLYDFVNVPRTAPDDEVRRAVTRTRETLGPEAHEGRVLGPARAAAKDVWSLLVEAESVLTDPERRREYDASLAPPRPPGDNHKQLAERRFFEGKALLAEGSLALARAAFEDAVRAVPIDGAYVAHLGWAALLDGSLPEERAMAILESALAVNRQAATPYFFLGLAALRRGDIDSARSYLGQAARRSPGDDEILTALRSLRS